MSNSKMKSLLKGLRYISQIFDNEKEPEMQIGHPTDVKHVAHIGWDGTSVNSPSWMNEFKSPLGLPKVEEGASVNWGSPASSRRSVRSSDSPARNLPELATSSRRQSSNGTAIESPAREKPDRPRSRRSSKSKDSPGHSKSTRKPVDPNQGSESTISKLPDIPKRSRMKKSKESPVGGSTRIRSKALALDTYQSPFSDPGAETGSIPVSMNNEFYQNPFDQEMENKEIYMNL